MNRYVHIAASDPIAGMDAVWVPLKKKGTSALTKLGVIGSQELDRSRSESPATVGFFL